MNLKVRKKKNSSGSTSVQIVDRENRQYKVIETIGCSNKQDEIKNLYKKALQRIDEINPNLFSTNQSSNKYSHIKDLLADITTDNFIPVGDELIFGKLFDSFGCNKVFSTIKGIRKIDKKKYLFKSLVISRIDNVKKVL